MCSELKLLDDIPLQSKTFANYGVIPSEDSHYCIIVEDGIYIFQLCGFTDNFLKTLSFTKNFVDVKDYVPSSNLGIDLNTFKNALPRFELYEAILRLDLSEEVNFSFITKQQATQAKWSPIGLVANNNCLLGVMKHTGSLMLLTYTLNEVEYENFTEVCNVSEVCLQYLRNRFFPDEFEGTPSDSFAEMKRRAVIATSHTFTWSHLINEGDKTFCLVILGHSDGGITVCRVKCMKLNEIQCECAVIGYYQTGLTCLTAMHWQKAGNNGLLVVGDLQGKAKAISITNISWDNVDFGSETVLWDEDDNIRVDYFKVIVYENNIYIFIAKGTALLICLINKEGNVVDVNSYQTGNIQITGLEHYDKNFIWVLTYTGVLKEIKFNCESGKILLESRNIYIDFKWWRYRTHGLVVSQNKVFIGILVSFSKLTTIKKRKDHVHFLIFMNSAKNPLEALLNNSSNLLTKYWDCLEVLRINSILQRKLPMDELPRELDYDKLSLVQLKTCFWLGQSSHTVHDKTQVFRKDSILKVDEVKYILKIKLAVDHTHRLLEILANGGTLSEFHMQSLDIINMFLKETVISGIIHKLGLGKVTIDELYEVIIVANELKYPPPPKCLWCEEHVLGLTCVPSHPDMRCQISYMPITKLPLYKCPFCKCVVHEKLTEVYKIVLCPYCDVSLRYVSRILDKDKDLLRDEEMRDDVDFLSCYGDCLKEVVNFDDVEDHAFINFTEEIDILSISSDDRSVNETQSLPLSSTENQV